MPHPRRPRHHPAVTTPCSTAPCPAQVQREAAAAAQERTLLADLRSQRMAEQGALIAQLAEERSAAARQQGEAEHAVDAARGAELAAAKILADLQAKVGWGWQGVQLVWTGNLGRSPSAVLCCHRPPACTSQAANAKHATEAAQARLDQVQERCAAEEARLAALQAAVAEQRASFDAQVRTMLDLGQQASRGCARGRGTSRPATMLLIMFCCLPLVVWAAPPPTSRCPLPIAQVKSQSEELAGGFRQLQEAQAAVKQQQAALEEQGATVARERRAAQAEQAETEAAAQEAAQSRLAAAAEQRKLGQERLECLRAAELARDLQLRLVAQIRAALAAGVPGADVLWQQLAAEVGAPAAQLAQPLPAQPSLQVPAAGPVAAPAAPLAAPAAVAAVAQPAAGDDSSRYRAILADLEGSIQRWRGQLRAHDPVGYASSPVGSAAWHAPAPALASAAMPTPGGSPRKGGAAAGQEGCCADPSSPSRAVQTAVSCLDAPRACVDGARSLPCSPVARRGSSAPRAAAPPRRPTSAGAAVARSTAGSFTAGEVRAVDGSGITLDAEYSLPGSPAAGQPAKPRRWLKFKGGSGTEGGADWEQGIAAKQSSANADGSGGKGSWGRGIFAFRRSVDGGK